MWESGRLHLLNLRLGYYGNGTFKVDGNMIVTGNLQVLQSVSKAGGSFKIDDPLEPDEKYLYHSFVESPERLNIYSGNVETDAGGAAWVTLPEYFEALNENFRYQLTCIGTFSQAIVAEEIREGRFLIQSSPIAHICELRTILRHGLPLGKFRHQGIRFSPGVFAIPSHLPADLDVGFVCAEGA